MKNEIYTPMEQVLINAAKLLTTKEVCEESIETKQKAVAALELDEMLLKMEAQFDMMDGVKQEEWLL